MKQENDENPQDTGKPVHPILPKLEQWALSSKPPIIPFQESQKFKQELINARLHDHAKRQIFITYQSAAIISSVICGHPDSKIHELAYRAAQHVLGFALCDATYMAHRTSCRVFATFAASTGLQGFLQALETWAAKFYTDGFDWKQELSWTNRNLIGEDQSASDFWIKECLTVSADTLAFTRELAAEVNKADAAKRMKEKRSTKRKPSKFRDDILVMWIAGALWCRESSGILLFLAPKETDGIGSLKRIDRDISDLGFSSSRQTNHQETIDEAEKN